MKENILMARKHMFNIIIHKGKVNPNHSEKPLYIHKNYSIVLNVKRKTLTMPNISTRVWSPWNFEALLVVVETGSTAWKTGRVFQD